MDHNLDERIATIAARIDSLDRSQSVNRVARELWEELPHMKTVEDLNGATNDVIVEQALEWMLGYEVDAIKQEEKWRVVVQPRFRGADGEVDPPELASLPEQIIDIWRSFARKVESKLILARIHHLIFERKDDDAFLCARNSASCYLEAARDCEIGLQRSHRLHLAYRIAKAVGAREFAMDIAKQMIEDASALAKQITMPGVIMRLVHPLVDDSLKSSKLDDALELAIECYAADPFVIDDLLSLQLKREQKLKFQKSP